MITLSSPALISASDGSQVSASPMSSAASQHHLTPLSTHCNHWHLNYDVFTSSLSSLERWIFLDWFISGCVTYSCIMNEIKDLWTKCCYIKKLIVKMHIHIFTYTQYKLWHSHYLNHHKSIEWCLKSEIGFLRLIYIHHFHYR